MAKIHPQKKSPYTASKTSRLLKILHLLIEAEIIERHKYQYLYQNAPTAYEKEILKSIYCDEAQHEALLKELYLSIAKAPLPPFSSASISKLPIKNQLETNVVDEIDAARQYNELMRMLEKTKDISIIQTLIHDEQNHAILNLYLLNQFT